MRNKKELMRVQSVIENDRVCAVDGYLDLVISDINNLLTDYFEFNGLPQIKIDKINDRYKVSIEILASRIKSFEIIPKR